MNKKKSGPKKGAVRKWSDRLEQVGKQTPPSDLLKQINIPKKGAGRRLAERLKMLGQQEPPESLIKKINGG